MFSNQNNLYFIALLCILAMFVTCMVYLQRRDRSAWKILILVSGALMVATLIVARYLIGDQSTPALFAPGLGVAAAALIGLLVATLLGPKLPTAEVTATDTASTSAEPTASSEVLDAEKPFIPVDVDEATNDEVALPANQEPITHEHDPFKSAANGNLSLVEINADLAGASNDGAMDDFEDIDENFIGTGQESAKETTDVSDDEDKWRAPVTSLHERRISSTDDADRGNWGDDVRTDLKEEQLDLSDSEQLFNDMRNDIQSVELPDSEQWLNDADLTDDVDLSEDTLVRDSMDITQNNDVKDTTVETDAILEAELIDDDEAIDPDATLNFGDDTSGEYAIPETAGEGYAAFEEDELVIPQTLDEAMVTAKQSAADLQAQVDKLEVGLASFDSLRDQQYVDASHDQLLQADSLIKRDSLLQVESETMAMQDNIMVMQRKLLRKTARRQQLVSALLKQERRRLAIQQEEIEKARRMARQAAIVARKAASAQQLIQDVAKREQTARIKAQSSAKKAMDIARNAVNALNQQNGRSGTHY